VADTETEAQSVLGSAKAMSGEAAGLTQVVNGFLRRVRAE
jgi:hypothetical protein